MVSESKPDGLLDDNEKAALNERRLFRWLKDLRVLKVFKVLKASSGLPHRARRCFMIVEEAQRFFDFFFDEPVFPFEDLLFFEPLFFEGILRF